MFGELAGRAGSVPSRNAWRFAAWAISAVLYAWQIAHEVVKLRQPARTAAWRASAGVMIGTFGLAALANIHELRTAEHIRPIMPLTLVVWPALTGIGSFVCAWVFAAVLSRVAPRATP